jgi:hypothetical protein
MHYLHLPWVRKVCLGAWCVGWLAITGLLLMPITVSAPSGADLAVHVALFGAMAFGAVSFCHRPLGLALLAGLTAILGGVLEVAQTLVPSRSFDLKDALADASGAAMGLVAALIVLYALIRPSQPRLRELSATS